MEIDNATVDKLCDLAKLEFNKDAREEIIKDLNNILVFVNKLNELDTSNVEPLIYISDEVNILREDIARQNISQQDALKNAPKRDSDYFKAPKVLEKK